ncbi:GNAT family N-acetyltransferase [Conexibacter sp. SYSU D00693]|uniref:GNAT family N-acetyltransferase n=1 Tax=Conexibacter sp. SYSU D00693 TaxID=2812560 RepID=UPI00196A8D33|nr:GNAT family N-acetyltransferase [Conexibacter sp. SYSU D00693]
MAVAELTVRPAEPDDVDAVLAVWREGRSPHARTADTEEVVVRLLRDAPGALIVAEDAGDVVGVVIAGWDGWRGQLHRLAVVGAHRRPGVGSALVRAGEERLRQLGTPHVSALVGRDDPQAAALWTAAGYRLDDDIGRWVRDV